MPDLTRRHCFGVRAHSPVCQAAPSKATRATRRCLESHGYHLRPPFGPRSVWPAPTWHILSREGYSIIVSGGRQLSLPANKFEAGRINQTTRLFNFDPSHSQHNEYAPFVFGALEGVSNEPVIKNRIIASRLPGSRLNGGSSTSAGEKAGDAARLRANTAKVAAQTSAAVRHVSRIDSPGPGHVAARNR
jgi:hypothetical protein